MKFPKVVATKPPKPLSKRAARIGRIAAGILAFFAIVQIIGIVQVVDGLGAQFLGNEGWAIFVIVLVLLSEILAIPFLLRAKMSDLARLKSGFFAVLAPWMWVMILIWSVGEGFSAVQFGVFGSFKAEWWLLILNVAWLVFNFYAVRQLNLEKTWRDIINSVKKSKVSQK